MAAVGIVIVAAGLGGCGASSSATENGDDDVRPATDAGANKLERDGLEMTVPAGWHGESFVNDRGMTVLRVGSFTFPERPDDDVGQIAREKMGKDDVLINIVDFTAVDSRDATYRPLAGPLTVDGSEATGQEGYPVPAVIDSVLVDGHKLYLSVAFGRDPPSAAQVAVANDVLRTVAGSP